MLTGELRSQIDAIWNSFWSGGISNPLEVMEQITYLLFLRRLDDLHTLEENKSVRLGKPMERRIFPQGADAKGRDFNDLRWSRFKNFAPAEMYAVVGEHVFPFLRTGVAGDGSTYAHHMKDARFTIPTPALLAKVVDMLDHVPMEDRDTKGDLYEYMLGKIASAGQNGQFRTPRHIIRLMVELTAPTAKDVICDPASGTCGFLVAAGEYLREKHPEILRDAQAREHFHHGMFHGYDFDNTMLRIGSMNLALHGVDNPDIRYKDSLAQDHAGDEERYSLILANPPFAGSLDYENTAKGHGRQQEGLRDARQCLPSRKPCRGSSAWLRQHLRKPHIAERLDLSKPHIPPCQQKVSTRGWCGRQSRPHQSCLVLCDESAKKHNDGSSPEFSKQYARARLLAQGPVRARGWLVLKP